MRQALLSMLVQSRPLDQLVVVDDSGEGAYRLMVERMVAESGENCELIYVRNPRNLGLVESLNAGLAACGADLVARMDADDIALPFRVEAQARMMARGYDLVGGGIVQFGQKGLVPVRYPTNSLSMMGAFLKSNPFAHPAVMFRREAIVSLGGYRDVPHAEDLDLWVRCLGAGLKMCNLSLPVLMYRQHAQQVSVQHHETQLRAARAVRRRVASALWARWMGARVGQGGA